MSVKKENIIINKLADAWNLFVKLPVLHPEDKHEFMHAIHKAQNIILSRPTIRKRRKK